MVVDANKEREQRDADLIVKQAELEKEAQASVHQAQIDAASDAAKLDIERERIASNERIKMAEILSREMIEREKMDREDARVAQQAASDTVRKTEAMQ